MIDLRYMISTPRTSLKPRTSSSTSQLLLTSFITAAVIQPNIPAIILCKSQKKNDDSFEEKKPPVERERETRNENATKFDVFGKDGWDGCDDGGKLWGTWKRPTTLGHEQNVVVAFCTHRKKEKDERGMLRNRRRKIKYRVKHEHWGRGKWRRRVVGHIALRRSLTDRVVC